MAEDDSWGYGNGIFGHWIRDGAGHPAYVYNMDQTRDPPAATFTTLGPSTDHWHQIGNHRLTATAHNGGYVQVYDWSRGGKLLNRWHPVERRFAGGFCWVGENDTQFATLWDALPEDARQVRLFGMGYFEKRTTWREVEIIERIEAPPGDAPCLRHYIEVRNQSSRPRHLVIVPWWEANMHQLTVAGLNPPWLARLGDWNRARKNRRFRLSTHWDEETRTISAHYRRRAPAPPPEQVSGMDHYPKSVFLTLLEGPQAALTGCCGAGGAFFDKVGAPTPGLDGHADGALLQELRADRAHAVLSLRFGLDLPPGGLERMTCAYGVALPSELIPTCRRLEEEKRPRALIRPRCAVRLEPEWLGRELEWHASYLEGGAFYHEHFEAHFVDQGSAYSYLHGASGAPRDYALFILPMVYLNPGLARDMLRFLFKCQKPSGKFPYAHVGHGLLRGYGVHSFSSDLDLFVLWAAAEYLGATGDHEFLREILPYYSKVKGKGKQATVLEHLEAAFHHLVSAVGTGKHGLIRSRTGDWNDVFMAFSPLPPITALRGESALNGALAALALPRLANAIRKHDPAFAQRLEDYGVAQAKALDTLWTGEWLARGYLGWGHRKLGADRLFLDAQPFPVLAGLWDGERRAALFAAIQERCVAPQGVGALALDPPMTGPLLQPGSDTNGGVWAAIDGLLAWAWSGHDPARAWRFYLSTTLAARAEAYPEVWYGVWSGPDAYNAHYHDRPGETFSHNFTPMTNYPVMNMNRHALPLLAGIKFGGFDWDETGVVIRPRLPEHAWSMELGLVGARYEAGETTGYFCPPDSGRHHFRVAPPSECDDPLLEVNDKRAGFRRDDEGCICFEASKGVEERITWRIYSGGSDETGAP